MKTYVLCNWHPDMHAGTCISSLDAAGVAYNPAPEHALRFKTVEEAIAFRSANVSQLTYGAHKYRVHELLPDGRLVDVEP